MFFNLLCAYLVRILWLQMDQTPPKFALQPSVQHITGTSLETEFELDEDGVSAVLEVAFSML